MSSFAIQPTSSPSMDLLNLSSRSPNVFEDIADRSPGHVSHQQFSVPPLFSKKSGIIENRANKTTTKRMLLEMKDENTKKTPSNITQKNPSSKGDPQQAGLLNAIFQKEVEGPKRIDKLKNLWSLRKRIHRESPMAGKDAIVLKPSMTKEMPASQNRYPTPVKVKQILRKNTMMTDKTDGCDLNGESSELENGSIGQHLMARKLKNPQEISFLTSMSPPVGKMNPSSTNNLDDFDLNKPARNNTRGRELRMDIPKEYQVNEKMSFKFFYQKFKNPTARGNSLNNGKFVKGQESPQLNFSFDTVQRPRKITLTKIDEVDHKHDPKLNISFQSTVNLPGGEYDQGRKRGRTLPRKPTSDMIVEVQNRGTRVNTTEGEHHNQIRMMSNGPRKEYGRSPSKRAKNYPADASFAALKSFLGK